MLTAYYHSRLISVDDYSEKFLKDLSDEKNLFCVDCGEKVIFKHYQNRQNHFSHYQSDCTFPFREPESVEHETGKAHLLSWLKKQFQPNDCVAEQKINQTNQRADTFVHSINTAVEYQCSPIQSKTWETRHQLYNSANIKNLWILGYSMHSYYNQNPYQHRFNQLERKMIEHHNRIIYYDILSKQFVFLIPEFETKRCWIGKEYFLKPNEVLIKNNMIISKYDFFFSMQKNRHDYTTSLTSNANETSNLIKETKKEVSPSKKELATKRQINYIKFLLYKTNKQMPYKFHGLLKEQASELISRLKQEAK